MMPKSGSALIALVLLAFLSACTYTTRVDDSPGRRTVYEDPGTPGIVQGVGLESQDIVSMTDKMMRDMLSNRALAGRTPAARVIVDSAYFKNESSSRINKNILTDRLRVQLQRAAQGRIVFVGRHYADMVEKERDLKREGMVDTATTGLAKRPAGADFRLGGRITSLDAVDQRTGMKSRFHQIVFEMVDLEAGILVWTGMYQLKKSGQDDVIYR